MNNKFYPGQTVASIISKYLDGSTPPDSATPEDVLEGKQFVTTGYSITTGTMPDNGDLGTIVPTTTPIALPEGYTSGGTVAGDADLIAGNIADGVTIFGVTGNLIEATGDATASQVLDGVTYSNSSGANVGTMPNNGSLGTITPTTTNQTIPSGYTTGGTVAGDSDLVAGNIKVGVDIFNVTGTFTSDADALAGDIFIGKTAYVNGVKLVGTNDGGIPPAGDALPADVIDGKTFINISGNQIGTMPVRTGDTAALSSSISGTTLKLLASDGYRNGTTDNVTITDADFIAENIKNGINVFGLTGTLEDVVINGQTEETAEFMETISQYDPIYIKPRFDKLANPATLPTGTGSGVAFSSDGVYMAVAHSTTPFITIYKRSGDTFTKLADPATLPAATGLSVAFSYDVTYMAVAHATTPFITIYKRSGDTFTKIADPGTLPAGAGRGVSFSTDGVYMAVAHDTSPFITIYKRSGDVFTKLTNPSTLPTGIGRGVAFSDDVTYMAVAHETSPFTTIYKRSGDTFTKLTNPSTLPTGVGNSVTFSTDGAYMAVAHDTTPYITIYKRSGDTFTKLTNPSSLPPSNGNGVAFSTNGVYMVVAHSSSPFVTIYKKLGDTFTKLADPATLPASTGNEVALSYDVTYMAVAHITTPFVTIYDILNTCFKSLGALDWQGADAVKSGYAKEAGVATETKTVIITHR